MNGIILYVLLHIFSFNKRQLSVSIHVDLPILGNYNIEFCGKNITCFI